MKIASSENSSVNGEKGRMNASFMPARDVMDDLPGFQLQGLRWTVSHVFYNSLVFTGRNWTMPV